MTKIEMQEAPLPSKRGGHNEHINRRTTQSIFRAFDFATEIGTPLNTYVVINLPSAGDRAADRLFRAIRHKFRDWLKHLSKARGTKAVPAYVFTFENPDGHTHVNWVLHVPETYKKAFAAKLPKWVAKVNGTLRPFDVDLQPVTGNAKTLAKYIVKGTDPAFVDHFYLTGVHAPQGWFRGQRARVSASLDKTARAAAGFRSRRAVGQRPAWMHTTTAHQQQQG